MSLPSLDRVWSEFGESPENLQTHSKLTNFMQKILTIKTKMPLDFRKNMSLDRVWRISKLTGKCFLKFVFFLPKKLKTYQKNEFGESPNSLQTQKNMRAQLFPRKICVQPLQKSQKTTCARHAYFFIEFGESLEILQTHFFLPVFIFWGEKTRRRLAREQKKVMLQLP